LKRHGGRAKPDGDGLFAGRYPAEYPQFSELPKQTRSSAARRKEGEREREQGGGNEVRAFARSNVEKIKAMLFTGDYEIASLRMRVCTIVKVKSNESGISLTSLRR